MYEGSADSRPAFGVCRSFYGERKLLCVRIGRTEADGFQGWCLHNRRIGVPDRRIQITTHNARARPPACLTQPLKLIHSGAGGSECECWREARCCVGSLGTLLPTPPPRTLSRPPSFLFSLFDEDCRRTCNMPSLRHHPPSTTCSPTGQIGLRVAYNARLPECVVTG